MSLSRAHQWGTHYFVQSYYPCPKPLPLSRAFCLSSQADQLATASFYTWMPHLHQWKHVRDICVGSHHILLSTKEARAISPQAQQWPLCLWAPQQLRAALFTAPHTLLCCSSREKQPSQWGSCGLSSRRSAANQTHRILLLERERAGSPPQSHSSAMTRVGNRLWVFSLQL